MALEDKDIEAGVLPPPPLPPKDPEPTYQVPAWESSSRTQKTSLFSRLASHLKPAPLPAITDTAVPPAPSTASTATAAAPPNRSDTDLDDLARPYDPEKDKVLEAGALPHHTTSLHAGTALPATTTTITAAVTTTTTTTTRTGAAALRARFDRLLPPHRTYLGWSRKFFLLAVVLPLCIVFLLVLPLALGLGLRNKGGAALPLPSDAGAVYTGDITYYEPALGACGWENDGQDAIVAVSRVIWDEEQVGANPNNNPLCGKKIRVRREMEGVGWRSVDVTVVDRCVGCAAQDLDLTLGMFEKLAAEELGRVTAEWVWLD